MALEDLQKDCLAGVLSAWDSEDVGRERFQKLTTELSGEHFQGEYYRVWEMLSYYGYAIDAVPSPDNFKEAIDKARNLSVPEKVRLIDHFDALSGEKYTDMNFAWSVARLHEQFEEDKFDSVLRTALAIQNGIQTHKGQELSGFRDSRDYLLENLQSAGDTLLDAERRMEGDVNSAEDANAIIDRYLNVKKEGVSGIPTGLADLDLFIGGVNPGDMMLIAGFTSVGKSKVAQNIAYNACYNLGKNVVFGVNEVTREQTRLVMAVRHSHHDRFSGRRPLRYLDVKRGDLEHDDEEFLREVVMDMSRPVNEDGSRKHGRMFIFQMPSHSNIDYVRNMMNRVKRNFDIDLLVIDYLGLMSPPGGRRTSKREETDELLVSAKRLAIEMNVPLVSPWQISREAWNIASGNIRNQQGERVPATNRYTRASLSDTSQAEKTSDIIVSLFKANDADGGSDAGRDNLLRCQILKNRDGDVGMQFDLITDFATGWVGSGLQYDEVDDTF